MTASAKKIFVWVAHPKATSLCGALADSYEAGAIAQGAQVRRMNLSDMSFDLNFEGYKDPYADGKKSDANGALEPDLMQWQSNMRWADHVMIVHPYWWGAMPTKAKAVLDRALTPGFAFKYHQRGVKWDKLLAGKTADAIITSDTPPLLDTLLYRSPGRRVIKNQVLDFCGIKSKNVVQFGSVKLASDKKISRWIGKAERLGKLAA
ncbi:NAD(P)H-dependent oxidoreductase [Pyruvatibacter sp.]|uniref:NAD(P)H-dependent oxidoreductase n=1 Tax=Pyruvatibacter sp. TaxID=1981328 RepID=UPI0032EB7DAF